MPNRIEVERLHGWLEARSFQVQRDRLYSPDELFAGFDPARLDSRLETLDHRIYEEYLDDGGHEPHSVAVSLAHRLHDHSVADRVREHVRGRRVVAIMGGHGLVRASAAYGAIARVARRLTRSGFLLASGGGPGAMEATHLGAWLAPHPDAALDAALTGPFVRRPAGAPDGKEYADMDWLQRAMALRDATPNPGGGQSPASLAVPTWLYGHEPPAVFATHIAKYFENALREDRLLALARHGVVFAPGSAGTVQEVFQDLTQNFYGVMGVASPMVFFDQPFWTKQRPVWALIDAMRDGRPWADLVSITSDPDEVVERLAAFEPLHHLAGTPDRELEAWLRRRLKLGANIHFVHVGEVNGRAERELADDRSWRREAQRLIARGIRRRGGAADVETPVGPLERGAGPELMVRWLCGLPDDWLSPARVASEVGAGFAELGIDEVAIVGGADTGAWRAGGVEMPGLLMLRRGRRLSVWAGELLD